MTGFALDLPSKDADLRTTLDRVGDEAIRRGKPTRRGMP